jgi:hypothetical protein
VLTVSFAGVKYHLFCSRSGKNPQSGRAPFLLISIRHGISLLGLIGYFSPFLVATQVAREAQCMASRWHGFTDEYYTRWDGCQMVSGGFGLNR